MKEKTPLYFKYKEQLEKTNNIHDIELQNIKNNSKITPLEENLIQAEEDKRDTSKKQKKCGNCNRSKKVRK